jgi:hypothetical protein
MEGFTKIERPVFPHLVCQPLNGYMANLRLQREFSADILLTI